MESAYGLAGSKLMMLFVGDPVRPRSFRSFDAGAYAYLTVTAEQNGDTYRVSDPDRSRIAVCAAVQFQADGYEVGPS